MSAAPKFPSDDGMWLFRVFTPDVGRIYDNFAS